MTGKQIIIYHCFDCPDYDKGTSYVYCGREERILTDVYNIPKWCRLKNI